jgi:hypothetical protein
MDVLGVRTCSIDGDMTRLWYSDIQHRWRESPAALAGLTAHGPLFCFAELARDVRMRVVFRAEHRAAAAGGSHVMRGPVSMVSDALRACRHAGSLGSEMADIVARCPSGRVEIASASVTEGAPVSPADEDALYTWVIAPAANA